MKRFLTYAAGIGLCFGLFAQRALAEDGQPPEPPLAAEQPKSLAERSEIWQQAYLRWNKRLYIKSSPLYNPELRNENARGVVEIRFLMAKDGTPQQCHIQQSSGHAGLDALACEAVRLAGRTPVWIDEDGRKQDIWKTLQIGFKVFDDHVQDYR